MTDIPRHASWRRLGKAFHLQVWQRQSSSNFACFLTQLTVSGELLPDLRLQTFLSPYAVHVVMCKWKLPFALTLTALHFA